MSSRFPSDFGRVRRRVFGAIALGAALLNLPGPLQAQATPPATARRARLTGIVTEEGTKRPLAGVNIFVVGTPVTGTTGPDGRYVIPSAPVGIYSIDARRLGFAQSRTENVRL